MHSTQLTDDVRDSIVDILLKDHEKEYYCHMQFVYGLAKEMALDMAVGCGWDVDVKVVEVAALLHDVGRGKENENEGHEVAGARIAESLIDGYGFSQDQKKSVLQCILRHNLSGEDLLSDLSPEEKIIITADSLSKITYHEAFMLLCKKTDYRERALWGMKYLDKSIGNILLDKYVDAAESKYRELKSIYGSVLA